MEKNGIATKPHQPTNSHVGKSRSAGDHRPAYKAKGKRGSVKNPCFFSKAGGDAGEDGLVKGVTWRWMMSQQSRHPEFISGSAGKNFFLEPSSWIYFRISWKGFLLRAVILNSFQDLLERFSFVTFCLPSRHNFLWQLIGILKKSNVKSTVEIGYPAIDSRIMITGVYECKAFRLVFQ